MALLLDLFGLDSSALAADDAPIFRWAKQVEGIKGNSGESIAVDSSGNTYVTGLTDYERHEFIGTHSWSSKGGKMFLAKYTSTGKQFWLQKTGGGGRDYANGEAVAVDRSGHTYVAGCFSGKVIFDKIKLKAQGSQDAFLAQYDANGNAIWVRQTGGKNGFCVSCGAAADKNGNIYVTGSFGGKAKFGTNYVLSRSGSDVFLVKYDVAGNVLWMRQAGEMGENSGASVAVDENDSVYVTGRYANGRSGDISISFGTIKIKETFEACLDGYIAKYDHDGNVVWAQATTGHYEFGHNSVVADKRGNIFVAGSFTFNPKFGGISLAAKPEGNADIFLLKYDANGKILWGISAGGIAHDECFALATDGEGNVYLAGFFDERADFGRIHVEARPHDPQLSYSPAFVAKCNSAGDFVWVKSIDVATAYSPINGIALDSRRNIYITGTLDKVLSCDGVTLNSRWNFWGQATGGVFVAKIGADGN
jgi:hypothetical protein